MCQDGGGLCVDLVQRLKGLEDYLAKSTTASSQTAEKTLQEEAASTIVRILGEWPRRCGRMMVSRHVHNGQVSVVLHAGLALGSCDDGLRGQLVDAGLVEEIARELQRLGGKANGQIPKVRKR